MLKAILFDLDGTLLDNPMERFVPAYLEGLAHFAADHVPPDRLIRELARATNAMDANEGNGPTNAETFASVFYPALGVDQEVLRPVFERFYAEEFPKLAALTRPAPEARPLVSWAFTAGFDVVIATNPLFPRTAIEQRLAWAGVGVEEFRYSLVTTYEIMHATKEHPAYYREILERINRRPEECLMIGDDWAWDIRPTVELGMLAWWAVDVGQERPLPALPLLGQGTIGDLWYAISTGRVAALTTAAPAETKGSS